jgi:DNA-binding response OmpR family regulator
MENEVLIISSTHRNRIGLATGLASLGYTVADASSVTQADQSIRNEGLPHMIIVDLHGIDQDQLLKLASRHQQSVRFIAIGDNLNSLDHAIGQQIGADAILPMPRHLHDMREYIQHITHHLYR